MQRFKTLFYLLFPSCWMGLFCFLHFHFNYCLPNRFIVGISMGIIVAYNLQKAIKFYLHSPQHKKIEIALKEYSRGFLILNWLLIFGTFYCLFPFLKSILIVASLPIVFVYVFYVTRFWKLKPLREIPYLKSFLVAFVWLMFMRILPQYMEQSDFSVIKIVQTFLFFFFLAVSADVYDLEIDKPRLKSLPIIFTRIQFLVFQLILIGLIFLRFEYSPVTYLALALCGINCFVCYRFRSQGLVGKLLLDINLVFRI